MCFCEQIEYLYAVTQALQDNTKKISFLMLHVWTSKKYLFHLQRSLILICLNIQSITDHHTTIREINKYIKIVTTWYIWSWDSNNLCCRACEKEIFNFIIKIFILLYFAWYHHTGYLSPDDFLEILLRNKSDSISRGFQTAQTQQLCVIDCI